MGRSELEEEMRRLREEQIRLKKNFEDYNKYWRERVAYISIIVGNCGVNHDSFVKKKRGKSKEENG